MEAYGNLMNRLMETAHSPLPKLGDGATTYSFSDRHAYTVTEIFKKGVFVYVVIQEDVATRTDTNGMSDSQDYSYEPNPKGQKSVFRSKIEKGSDLPTTRWERVYLNDNGRYIKADGHVTFGIRDKYYDYSF